MFDITKSEDFVGTFESFHKGYYTNEKKILFPMANIHIGRKNIVNPTEIDIFLSLGFILLDITNELDKEANSDILNCYIIGGTNLSTNSDSEYVFYARKAYLYLHPLSCFTIYKKLSKEIQYEFDSLFSIEYIPDNLLEIFPPQGKYFRQ